MNNLLYPLKRIIFLSFILFTIFAGEGLGCECENQLKFEIANLFNPTNDSGQENSSGEQSGSSSGEKNGQKGASESQNLTKIVSNSQIKTLNQQPVAQEIFLTRVKNSSAPTLSRPSRTSLFPDASSSQIRPLNRNQQPVTWVTPLTNLEKFGTAYFYNSIFDVQPDDNRDLINWVEKVRSDGRKIPYNLLQETSYELFMQVLINDIEEVVRNNRSIDDNLLKGYEILFKELKEKISDDEFESIKKYKDCEKKDKKKLLYGIVPIVSASSYDKMNEAIKNLLEEVYIFIDSIG